MNKADVAHTRLHLANERTLLGWTKLGCIFAAGGFLSRVLSPKQTSPSVTSSVYVSVQLLLAAAILAIGISVFRWRRALLASKFMGSYGASTSLRLAICGIFVMLMLTLAHAVVQEAVYNSEDCLRLPLPLSEAPPPYLYISFHGADEPLSQLCAGTGAVQRFSLQGEYVGPATDQRAALVHSPRGMALHNNQHLVLADAGEGAALHRPALAIFGDCAGRDKRPFLGRVRAPSKAMEAAFAHPYGVAVSSTSLIQVSAQNGGALLTIDLPSAAALLTANATAHFTVVAQLENTTHAHSLKSGPLRGLATTADDCSHVADKHRDALWHVCAGGADVSYTGIPHPIGVAAHDDVLYVGSFSDAAPAVYMLKRRKASSPSGAGEWAIALTISHKRLVHPAGLLAYQNVLYVLEQSHRALLTFDATSGAFLGELLTKLPDKPEGLLLSMGC